VCKQLCLVSIPYRIVTAGCGNSTATASRRAASRYTSIETSNTSQRYEKEWFHPPYRHVEGLGAVLSRSSSAACALTDAPTQAHSATQAE
jgi:hypothetical protein